MVLGMETAKALGEAGAKYEGGITETNNGIYIHLSWKQQPTVDKFFRKSELPKDNFLQDIFLAHHIRKLAEKLGKLVEKEAVKCTCSP